MQFGQDVAEQAAFGEPVLGLVRGDGRKDGVCAEHESNKVG